MADESNISAVDRESIARPCSQCRWRGGTIFTIYEECFRWNLSCTLSERGYGGRCGPEGIAWEQKLSAALFDAIYRKALSLARGDSQ
jgi:hypothetical protein